MLASSEIIERPYKEVGHNCENEAKYTTGGFHPVHLGDTFDGRYTVFRKLGWATESTVWLAKDSQTSTYVVLKILLSSRATHETLDQTFQHSPLVSTHPGKPYLSTQIRSFTFTGPNGTHLCLVLEPHGRSMQELMSQCSWALHCRKRDEEDSSDSDDDDEDVASGDEDENKESDKEKDTTPWYSKDPYITSRWPLSFAKKACHQLALAVDYLHSHQIMHRDLQPGNILLALSYNLNSLTKTQIQSDIWDTSLIPSNLDPESLSEKEWYVLNEKCLESDMTRTERVDGRDLLNGDPRYILQARALHDKLKFEPEAPKEFSIKLIDLGGACYFPSSSKSSIATATSTSALTTTPTTREDGEEYIPYPLDIRAPEVVLSMGYDEKADIWALGCTMYDILCLNPLICIFASETIPEDDMNSRILRSIIWRVGGKLPESLVKEWVGREEVLDENGELKDVPEGDDEEDKGGLGTAVRLGLGSAEEGEKKALLKLLEGCVRYEAGERLTSKDVAGNVWLRI